MSGFVIESADVYLCLLTFVLVNAVILTTELCWLQTRPDTSPGVQMVTIQLMWQHEGHLRWDSHLQAWHSC